MDLLTFIALVAACAPQVDIGTARALVSVESSFNANAIGVVAGSLVRQPRSRAEALATSRLLQADGWNYSVGLGQINARNFRRLGLTLETAFEPCTNLAAMQLLLIDCFDRASRKAPTPQRSLREALSCYYSGNFVTGFSHGYVRKVARAFQPPTASPASTVVQAKEPS